MNPLQPQTHPPMHIYPSFNRIKFTPLGKNEIRRFKISFNYNLLPFFRLTLLALIVFSMPYGVLDQYMIAENTALTYTIRYGIWMPAYIITLILSYQRFFIKYMELYGTIITLMMGLGIILMIYVSTPGELSFAYYYAGIAVSMMVAVVTSVRFWNTLLTNTTLTFAYIIVGIFKQELLAGNNEIHPVIFTNNLFFLCSFLIGTALASFIIEQYARISFIKQGEIKKERSLVQQKNKELSQKNEEITAQNEEITTQKEALEQIHAATTDSINYASRIQNAVLTDRSIIKKHFPEHFIIYKPKDIVSGDFYWASEVGDKQIFAVADCTGHGVPGAFMSILGMSLLNEIVAKGISESNTILDTLRNNIKNALKQKSEKIYDSMDISLFVYDKSTSTIQFSGAYNSLYLIRDNELTELKGDKQPIGSFCNEKPFASQRIVVKEGDMIYMTSDGFPDQMGGEKGKKYMSKRMKSFFNDISPHNLNTQFYLLEKEISDWKGSDEQIDDILISGIRINA